MGDNMKEKLFGFGKQKKDEAWVKYTLPKLRYAEYRRTLPLDDKAILVESQHGAEMLGNVFHLLKELSTNPEYAEYKLYLCCRGSKKNRFSYILENNGMKNVQLLELSTDEYIRALASSKYLINDNTFLPFFVKRQGQVYLNTWHGTPLKTLGKSIKNAMHGIGNAQKNFASADYLLYPNRYTMEHMVEDYMLENITDARCVLAGYPRNSAFFKEGLCQEVRRSMEIPEGMKIYAYMPTWRGSVGDIAGDANARLKAYLHQIDNALNEDERLYLNLHPIAVKDIDVKEFKRIRNIPVRFDTYDFLTSTDCLITDYSSVFYDYVVSGKKCVLFTYDEEEYFADRGVYMSLSELPFPKVKTVEELVSELRSPKQYDDKAFINEYCFYDCAEAPRDILELMLFGKKQGKTEVLGMPRNGKKNILLYADKLNARVIEDAVSRLSCKDENIFITFFAKDGKENMEELARLHKGVNYFPIQADISADEDKAKIWKKLLSTKGLMLNDDAHVEVMGTFGDAKFSKAINLSGEEIKLSKLFK